MPTSEEQVTYLTGVNSGGFVAAQTSQTWKNDNPATYKTESNAAKWGSTSPGTSGGTIIYDFEDASGWSATEQEAFKSVLALISAVANVSFSEVASIDPNGGNGIIFRRGAAGSGAVAHTLRIGTEGGGNGAINGTKLWNISQSIVNIETGEASFAIDGTFTKAGGHPWTTMIHEVAHALGLGHAGPYPVNGVTTESLQYSEYDSEVHTVMSYFHPADAAAYSTSYPVNVTWGNVTNPAQGGGNSVWKKNPVTLMPLDILALQRLYGAATSSPLSGGQIYGFNTNIGGLLQKFFDFNINTAPVVTLWNAGTGNSLDLSGYSTASVINLTAGSYSSAGTALANDGSTVINMVNNIAIANNTRIDTAIGGSGNDTINGNNNGNTLKGGTGNDTITGGTGADTLWGEAGTNTLNGGNGSDTARYALARASYGVVRNSNGTFTVNGTGINDTLSNIEFLGFSDQTIATASIGTKRSSDFNGDGKSDLVLQHTGGVTQVWLLNGSSLTSSYNVDPGSTSWKMVGANDFNGDGKSDLVLQHTNGTTQIWLLNGSSVISSYNVNPGSSSWKMVGTGDFNSDDRSDLVLQHENGLAQVWLMNGSSVASTYNLDPGNSSWKAVGTGDFDGDGKTDILMQHDNGRSGIWFRDASSLTDAGPSIAAGWHVRGTGDFDGDGKTDLVMQRKSGLAQVWLMSGATLQSAHTIDPGSSSWKIGGTGDFNGDGKSDLVFQHDNGLTQFWLMNGGSVNSTYNMDPGNSNWKIVSSVVVEQKSSTYSDFGGDGRSDILLQNGSGAIDVWLMNGAARDTSYGLNTGSSSWKVAGKGDFNGDGRSDFVLRHDNGLTQVWLLNGSSVGTSYNLDPGSSSWKVAGTGDFNGDGRNDLVLQNDNGLTQVWLLNGSSLGSFYSVDPGSNSWKVVGTADFNSDARSDLVLQHTNGTIQVWLLSGSTLSSSYNLNPGSSSWQVKGTGDFDGDGKADILIQNSVSGQAAIWFNGAGSASNAGSPLSAGWSLRSAADFNGDGKTDLLLQNTSGQMEVWVMDGATRQSLYQVTQNPGSAWIAVA